MRRASPYAALSTALLAACASASKNAPPEQVSMAPSNTRIETPGATYELRNVTSDRAEAITVKVKPEVAWTKMTAVYAEVGLPVNMYVDATRQIGARGVRARGRLGNVRLAQLVSCGTDVTGEDKASSYEITFDVASAIGAAPDGNTHVLTMVTASGRPMATSGDPVRCTTTGQLEKRIANALLVKSATSP